MALIQQQTAPSSVNNKKSALKRQNNKSFPFVCVCVLVFLEAKAEKDGTLQEVDHERICKHAYKNKLRMLKYIISLLCYRVTLEFQYNSVVHASRS